MTSARPSAPSREPLAIIGIGCHLPGGAATPDQFWDLLNAGMDATREVPADRWETAKFYDPAAGKLGKMATCRGGFLERVDQFDPQFFGISPREAVWIDPQQRLLLRTAWEALEDAGQDADALAGTDTGVFVGGFTLDYQLLQNYGVQSRYELQAHSATGMMMTMLANRLSFSFDFRGPSVAVDTACSGSLVAVHLAAQAIWNGECSVALAGGVNVMLAPNMTIAESKGGFLSPDGRCKTFSAAANGYARGEGAGVVLLKPLARAQADGDRIYAAVAGTAVSQDGHTSGITVPNGEAQEVAMRAAYARAGVRPDQLHYIEAHGTGTPVGDPIEVSAIGRVLAEGRAPDDPVVVGSVKTNIGHLEAAAGVAGLIKTALVLRHGRIPGNLHFTEPNPAIPFAELGVRVPTTAEAWPADGRTRYAGVNSFGFGGTNAHVVLHDVPSPSRPQTGPQVTRPRLLPLSARSPEALTVLAGRMAEHLRQDGGATTGGALADGATGTRTTVSGLDDIAFSCSRRRTHHEYRLTVAATDRQEAAEQLAAFARGEAPAGVASGRAEGPEQPKLVFVCTGMGPQWWAMGRQLLAEEPVFRAAVERCDAELARYTGWSLLQAMLADETDSRMSETEIAQPANFAVQVALAELWRSWGVVPDAIVGHSTGEVAAQYLAGVLSFEDAVKVNYYRSSLQQRATGAGRMLAVGLTAETLDKAVAEAGPTVSVAAVNGPSSVTLAGDAQVLEGMAGQLETFGVFHRFLPVKVPYHSHYMDPLREDLLAGLADLQPRPAKIPLYSTVTGTRLDGRTATAQYWWQNVRATVLFQAAFTELLADGYTHFLELGPHPVLAGAMQEVLAGSSTPGVVLSSMRRGSDEGRLLRHTLGTLHCLGHRLDWTALTDPSASYVPLPTYPWQLKRYWNESVEAVEDRHHHQVHPLLGQPMNAPQPTWEHEVNPERSGFLGDHQIQGTVLMPAAAFIEMAHAAARLTYGDADLCLEDLQLQRALVLSPTADPRLRTTLRPDFGELELASLTAHPSGERQWARHASVRVDLRHARPRRLDLPALDAELGEPLGRDAFYELTRSLGFQYGPTFQTVQSVRMGDGVATAAVQAPPPVADQLDAHLFHPSLLDAAFQLLITAAAAGRVEGSSSTYLPVGIDRITFFGKAAERLTVVARVRSSDDRLITSDLTICTPDGRCLVEIEGFRAQSLEASMSASPERIDAGLLSLMWEELPTDEDGNPPADVPAPTGLPAESDDQPTTWLLLTDAGGFGARLAGRVRARGDRVVEVGHASVASLTADDEDHLTLDPTAPGHFEALLAHLGPVRLSRIVHLWSLDTPHEVTVTAADLEAAQRTGVLSVTSLLQALSAAPAQLPSLWLVTRRAVSVPSDTTGPDLAGAPLWGLGRLVGHQEFPGLWGGLVDLDTGQEEPQADMLMRDVLAHGSEDQLAYRGRRRLVARLRPCPDLAQPLPTRLRPDATYLVTGGLGALGLVVTRFLAEHGARHIVLTGRRPLPHHFTWDRLAADHPQGAAIALIGRLRREGVQVHYRTLDVTDAAALADWHRAYRDAGHPEVRGVVHVAGVVDDQLLVRMDRERFAKVLRPKLAGGWNLHGEFAGTELDFFTLFSSTGSVITSPGQANYASANAFLDALAHHRRALGLPGQSIGWGPWAVGMVEDLRLEQVYARRGIELITPETGACILGRLLGQKPAHVLAITADWATARRTAAGGCLPAMFQHLGEEASTADAERSGADTAELLTRLRTLHEADRATELAGHLRAVTATVLGLEPDVLGPEERLSGLGMDSIMAIEVKHRVEAALHVEVSVLDLMQRATIISLTGGILEQLQLAPTGPTAEAATDAPEAVPASGDETPAGAEPPPIGSPVELEELLALLTQEELDELFTEMGVTVEAADTTVQQQAPTPAPPPRTPTGEREEPTGAVSRRAAS